MEAARATQQTASEIVPSVESTYRVTLLAHSKGGGLEAHFYQPRALNAEVALLDTLADHYSQGHGRVLMSKVERESDPTMVG